MSASVYTRYPVTASGPSTILYRGANVDSRSVTISLALPVWQVANRLHRFGGVFVYVRRQTHYLRVYVPMSRSCCTYVYCVHIHLVSEL